MKIFRLFPVLICLLSLAVVSCETDSWKSRVNMKSDKVTITKITAYGKQKESETLYKGQVGAVVFSHDVHENDVGLTCEACHHKNDNEDRIKQCAVCHNGYEGYDTMHGLCLDCHISRNDGPQECMGCH